MDQSDLVADRLDIRDDVRAEEDRFALGGELQDQLTHLLATDRIKPAHRLIQDQEFRVMQDRLSDAHTLKHAFRVFSELELASVGHADGFENRRDSRVDLRSGHAGECAEVMQHLFAGQMVVEVRSFR